MTNLMTVLKSILALTVPYIQKLVKSTLVPKLKRQAYEFVNKEADKLIKDLAQNASKIAQTEDNAKYIEGTKLGLEMVRALATKLTQAADEIENVL